MKQGYGFLRVGVTVFRVLAWVSLVLQIVVGLMLLIGGGAAIAIGGIDVPARVVGGLNCVAGVIYFFLLSLTADVVRLLLEIRERLEKGSA